VDGSRLTRGQPQDQRPFPQATAKCEHLTWKTPFGTRTRGVARIYQASLNDGVWKLWRGVPASGSITPVCSLAAAGRSMALGWAWRKDRSEARL
jgi:hypothetical protein